MRSLVQGHPALSGGARVGSQSLWLPRASSPRPQSHAFKWTQLSPCLQSTFTLQQSQPNCGQENMQKKVCAGHCQSQCRRPSALIPGCALHKLQRACTQRWGRLGRGTMAPRGSGGKAGGGELSKDGVRTLKVKDAGRFWVGGSSSPWQVASPPGRHGSHQQWEAWDAAEGNASSSTWTGSHFRAWGPQLLKDDSGSSMGWTCSVATCPGWRIFLEALQVS